MDKNKNVQNGFLRDYLFFLKKKFQKFQKFYFRCIIGKATKKFQKVFFCKKKLEEVAKRTKICLCKICKKLLRKILKKSLHKFVDKYAKNEMTQFNVMC